MTILVLLECVSFTINVTSFSFRHMSQTWQIYAYLEVLSSGRTFCSFTDVALGSHETELHKHLSTWPNPSLTQSTSQHYLLCDRPVDVWYTTGNALPILGCGSSFQCG
jgi:hypothetical protein